MTIEPFWTGIDEATLRQGDLLPLSGDFAVTNSYFYNVDSGPWFWNLVNSDLAVCYNTAVNAGVVDLSAVSGVSFGESLSIGGLGTLLLGGGFSV